MHVVSKMDEITTARELPDEIYERQQAAVIAVMSAINAFIVGNPQCFPPDQSLGDSFTNLMCNMLGNFIVTYVKEQHRNKLIKDCADHMSAIAEAARKAKTE